MLDNTLDNPVTMLEVGIDLPPVIAEIVRIALPVRGRDRAEAIARMSRALEMFVVEGIHTTIPLHRRIMRDPDFQAGNFDTKFMERFLAATPSK